jgi:hypothetical protein
MASPFRRIANSLRTFKQLGFQRFVVSDWASVEELVNHGIARIVQKLPPCLYSPGLTWIWSQAYLKPWGGVIDQDRLSLGVLDEAVRSFGQNPEWFV